MSCQRRIPLDGAPAGGRLCARWTDEATNKSTPTPFRGSGGRIRRPTNMGLARDCGDMAVYLRRVLAAEKAGPLASDSTSTRRRLVVARRRCAHSQQRIPEVATAAAAHSAEGRWITKSGRLLRRRRGRCRPRP